MVLPAGLTVRDALAQHYAAHRLPADGGAGSRWFHIRIGPVAIPVPNPPARRRAVILHDINHVLTGYDTVLTNGEMSIAAFEVGAGCGRYWIAWALNLPLMLIGLVVRPHLVTRAFARGRRSRSLYHLGADPDALRAMLVEELRATLGIAATSAPGRPDA